MFLFGSFPITFLTSAWLQMNSLTRCPGGEIGVAELSIGMSLTKGTYGISHSRLCKPCTGLEGQRDRGLQTSRWIGERVAGFAVSRQDALAEGDGVCMRPCSAVGPGPQT